MKIDCISDLHGHLPRLYGGDLLIVAGDLTARDSNAEHLDFLVWLSHLQEKGKYKKIVYIAGNHDGTLEEHGNMLTNRDHNIEYLCDSGTEFEGLKIWGSPWTPTFGNWHFMKDRGAPIKEKWDLIPQDTDILVTHGPPWGIQDKVERGNVGCEELLKAIKRVKPKINVFGHIHEDYGSTIFDTGEQEVLCINCSIMNEEYEPVNPPTTVNI